MHRHITLTVTTAYNNGDGYMIANSRQNKVQSNLCKRPSEYNMILPIMVTCRSDSLTYYLVKNFCL